jgi:hypothetical protein
MIRAGREVVDTHGIAALRGQAFDTAARRKPWDQPSHPAPVNTAQPGPGGRKRLWDREQVAEHVAGRPIPVIPADDDEHDLLDATEVAALRKTTVAAFNALVRDGRLAGPDAKPCGVPHWYRVTAKSMQPGPGVGVSRRPEDGPPTRAARQDIQQRLLDALDQVERRPDGSVNVLALSRAAGVSRLTARRFLDKLAEQKADPGPS